MKNENAKAIYFGLGYSALCSLTFLLMRSGLRLDIAIYPYQKPLMLLIAAIAMIAAVILVIFDIRRKCDCGIGMRIFITLAVIMLTFDSFIGIWGFLILYVGGA